MLHFERWWTKFLEIYGAEECILNFTTFDTLLDRNRKISKFDHNQLLKSSLLCQAQF